MKRLAVVFSLSVFFSALAAFGCIRFFNSNFASISNTEASEQTESSFEHIKSFQGDLADVIREIRGRSAAGKEKAMEAVPDIFADRTAVESPQENTSQEKNIASPDSTFSFAVLGDTQNFNIENPDGYFQQVMSSVQKLGPDLVVSVGDLVGECSEKKYCKRDFNYWKDILESYVSKTYAVQGNHDRTDGSKSDKYWQSAFDFPTNGPAKFSETAYFLDFKNTRLVFLASDNPEPHLVNGEQRAWLEKNLAGNKKENTFVFFHEPAFPAYEVAGESLDNHPSERDALWQILDKYNATGVFNGHEHIISRRLIDSKVFPQAKNSIYQFVFGNTDSFDQNLPKDGVVQYANQGQGRFGLVKVKGKEITIETRGPDGSLLDSFVFK